MAEPTWVKRYSEGILIGVLACIVFAGVSLLVAEHSPFFWPVFYALIAAGIVVLSGIAIVLLRRIPRLRILPSEKNIEFCVRLWLDTHKVMVKERPVRRCLLSPTYSS
jgi:hypothetical protein